MKRKVKLYRELLATTRRTPSLRGRGAGGGRPRRAVAATVSIRGLMLPGTDGGGFSPDGPPGAEVRDGARGGPRQRAGRPGSRRRGRGGQSAGQHPVPADDPSGTRRSAGRHRSRWRATGATPARQTWRRRRTWGCATWSSTRSRAQSTHMASSPKVCGRLRNFRAYVCSAVVTHNLWVIARRKSKLKPA